MVRPNSSGSPDDRVNRRSPRQRSPPQLRRRRANLPPNRGQPPQRRIIRIHLNRPRLQRQVDIEVPALAPAQVNGVEAHPRLPAIREEADHDIAEVNEPPVQVPLQPQVEVPQVRVEPPDDSPQIVPLLHELRLLMQNLGRQLNDDRTQRRHWQAQIGDLAPTILERLANIAALTEQLRNLTETVLLSVAQVNDNLNPHQPRGN